MALRTTSQSPNSVTIDDSNLSLIHENKSALENSVYWHKFLIDNVHGLKRNAVLKILFDYIKPAELIPLCYTQDGEGAFFFARMCKEAIEKLCKDKLTIPNSQPFKLKIVLRYSNTDVVKIDLTENIQGVLQKRLKCDTLNLSHFADDPDLSEFLPFSQRKLLAFVLNMTKNLQPKALKLCGNEIRSLDAFQIMSPQSVVSLDLRQNLITDLAELKYLSSFNITELWLEGNPLCDFYDEYNYVQKVITYCPKIEKLDGFLLRQNGAPSFRRNFLCDVSSYDIVDEFLGEYFPAFDSRHLSKLEMFYHKNALFSMTSEFFQKQQSSKNFYMRPYETFSRNILNLRFDTTKNLYQGSSEIMGLFSVMPHSEHDPCSFTVDVLCYTTACAIIVVTGVFREPPKTDRILGFNRYFVLENRDGRYRISNEQMHVFNALTSQQVTAFKNSNTSYEARDVAQQSLMVHTFATITNLSIDWAKMFLEECHYNLKHAMYLFVDLYKSDRIPPQGFKSSD